MCDMYGHAYWCQDSEEVIEDFLKWNSHLEIRMEFGLHGFLSLRDIVLRSPRQFLGVDPSGIEAILRQQFPGQPITMDYARCGFWVGTPDSWPAPCGLDPVDGKVIFHREPKPPDPQLAIAKLTARWDMAFPTTKELEPWIENHFAKRGDLENWQVRTALLLCDDATRRLGHMRRDVTFQYVGPPKLFPKPDDIPVEVRCAFVPTAGEAIDLLRKFPNDWWADRNRRGADTIRKRAEKSLVGVGN